MNRTIHQIEISNQSTKFMNFPSQNLTHLKGSAEARIQNPHPSRISSLYTKPTQIQYKLSPKTRSSSANQYMRKSFPMRFDKFSKEQTDKDQEGHKYIGQKDQKIQQAIQKFGTAEVDSILGFLKDFSREEILMYIETTWDNRGSIVEAERQQKYFLQQTKKDSKIKKERWINSCISETRNKQFYQFITKQFHYSDHFLGYLHQNSSKEDIQFCLSLKKQEDAFQEHIHNKFRQIIKMANQTQQPLQGYQAVQQKTAIQQTQEKNFDEKLQQQKIKQIKKNKKIQKFKKKKQK